MEKLAPHDLGDKSAAGSHVPRRWRPHIPVSWIVSVGFMALLGLGLFVGLPGQFLETPAQRAHNDFVTAEDPAQSLQMRCDAAAALAEMPAAAPFLIKLFSGRHMGRNSPTRFSVAAGPRAPSMVQRRRLNRAVIIAAITHLPAAPSPAILRALVNQLRDAHRGYGAPQSGLVLPHPSAGLTAPVRTVARAELVKILKKDAGPHIAPWRPLIVRYARTWDRNAKL